MLLVDTQAESFAIAVNRIEPDLRQLEIFDS